MFKILLLAVLLCNGLKADAQWTLNYQTLTNEIVEVTSSPDSNTCWFITNFDRLYKSSNGGTNWPMIVNGVTIPSDLFVLNNDTAVSLKVYDLNGRQVSVLINGIQKSEYYQ